MFKYKIEIKGDLGQLKGWDRKIKNMFISAYDAQLGLANKTEERLKSYIYENTRDGISGELGKRIKTYTEGLETNEYTIGVGLISELPPYWYVVNYGRRYDTGVPYIPPMTVGRFIGTPAYPSASFVGSGKQMWIKDSIIKFWNISRTYIMIPQKPIRPKNYIEKTTFEILSYSKAIYNGKIKKLKFK